MLFKNKVLISTKFFNHLIGFILNLAKTGSTSDQQLHRRTEMVERNSYFEKHVSSSLQRQRLCRLKHTHGQARSTEA